MATMKTRIITTLTTLSSSYSDLAACERQIARLQALGAPQSLITSEVARQAAMREELPRLINFIATHTSHHDSALYSTKSN